MIIKNPLKMNDWNIKSTSIVLLIFQMIILFLIMLDSFGLSFNILRDFFGLVYLLILPGVLILRVLRIHDLNSVESIVFQIGLSIGFLMGLGFLMNLILPTLGIIKPFSTFNIIVIFSVSIFLLFLISYYRDKDYCNADSVVNIGELKSPQILPQILIFCLIPFLSIIGAYLVTYYQNNFLLLVLLILIPVLVVLITKDKINKNLFPLAIFVFSISLLYQKTLIGQFINGADIQQEYYYFNILINNGFWNISLQSNYNAMLSDTIFPAILYKITNMDGTWLFKVVYPLIFAFVPLTLYEVYKKISKEVSKRFTPEMVAFLAVFFFISFFVFYSDMTFLVKQQISELFLSLFLLSFLIKKIDASKKAFLLILFSFLIAVSHYGMTYIFLLILLVSIMINYALTRFGFAKKLEIVTIGIIITFMVFALAWYMYISNGSIFTEIVHIADHIYQSFVTDFLSPQSSEGLNFVLLTQTSIIHKFGKYVHYISIFLIIIGTFCSIRTKKMDKQFLSFSIVAVILCVGAIIVPNFSSALNTTRFYHITLIFLSPFCIFGGIYLIQLVSKQFRSLNFLKRNVMQLIASFLIIFMLFNTGFVYELFNEEHSSVSISYKSMEEGTSKEKIGFFDYYVMEQDVYAQKWISRYTPIDSSIFMGWIPNPLMLYFDTTRKQIDISKILNKTTKTSQNSYIYLGYISIKDGIIVFKRLESRGQLIPHNVSVFDPILVHENKLYSNGGSDIFTESDKFKSVQ